MKFQVFVRELISNASDAFKKDDEPDESPTARANETVARIKETPGDSANSFLGALYKNIFGDTTAKPAAKPKEQTPPTSAPPPPTSSPAREAEEAAKAREAERDRKDAEEGKIFSDAAKEAAAAEAAAEEARKKLQKGIDQDEDELIKPDRPDGTLRGIVLDYNKGKEPVGH